MNGTTTAGPVVGQSFAFHGYYNQPNTTIHLQVLNDPTIDPNSDANWSEFATAVTSATAQYFNDPDPLYPWIVTAAPLPSGLIPVAWLKRWPQGGIVRVRAVHTDAAGSHVLTTFDDVTFSKCVSDNAGLDWGTIGQNCKGLGGETAALVSTTNIPAPPGGKGKFDLRGYLGRKDLLSKKDTEDYYTQINAPTSLFDFYKKFGFANGDVSAIYYNDADLGLGREMHCRDIGGGLACYVMNFSGDPDKKDPETGFLAPAFGVDPNVVLADAVGPKKSWFATVAMVYAPLATNPVMFMVYGPDGFRADNAALDTTENNTSVPSNCLACHGIDSIYNQPVREVQNGAQFLPFDPYSYKYSSQPGYTFDDQVDKFRQLNALVRKYTTAPGIQQLIDGMYKQGVNTPGAVANDDYVPSGWKNWAGAPHALDGTALYRGVVKVACRTCHVSATSRADLDFLEATDFTPPPDPKDPKGTRTPRVMACGKPHLMPHAERAMKKFWESGARAYLVTGLEPAVYPDATQACKS